MAGAPRGNQNAANGKKYKAALERALASRSRADGKEALDAIANVVIEKALAGEQWAHQQIADRLDGKPHQTIAAEVDTNVTVEVVRYGDGKKRKAAD